MLGVTPPLSLEEQEAVDKGWVKEGIAGGFGGGTMGNGYPIQG